MSHNLYIDGTASTPTASARILAISAAAVLMVAVLAVSGVVGAGVDYTAPNPQESAAPSQAEDWHGNVKRSHWRAQ